MRKTPAIESETSFLAGRGSAGSFNSRRGMKKLGAWVLCFTAISWFSVGGCQRPVVSPPQPIWHGSQRPMIPEPAEIKPPTAMMPQLPFGNPWKPSAPLRDWKHIVIHHTASSAGSVATIHAEHLQRKDKNGNKWLGIGYHFLIGNGSGMGDGEIEPTFRWKKQMQGAHAGNDEYNQHGIGICLVGNFQDHRPSPAQLAAVKRLVGVLKREYHIKSSEVVGHRDVKKTACPGNMFPLTEIAQSEDVPFFTSREPANSIAERANYRPSRTKQPATGSLILTGGSSK